MVVNLVIVDDGITDTDKLSRIIKYNPGEHITITCGKEAIFYFRELLSKGKITELRIKYE